MLDLIVEGNIGLLRALQTFGDTNLDSFSAHAAEYIERAITEASLHSGTQRTE
jgi:DNA-directed RNA polymerase sigma subunit (sigma70/sigma32)